MEGGSAWGASLYADIIWHWETRNKEHLLTKNNPAIVDKEALKELYIRYGGELVHGRLDGLGDGLGFHSKHFAPEDPGELDEFALAGIEKPEDVRDRFLNHFYFGTESDDTRVAQAFNRKALPFGDRVKAFLGSDLRSLGCA